MTKKNCLPFYPFSKAFILNGFHLHADRLTKKMMVNYWYKNRDIKYYHACNIRYTADFLNVDIENMHFH